MKFDKNINDIQNVVVPANHINCILGEHQTFSYSLTSIISMIKNYFSKIDSAIIFFHYSIIIKKGKIFITNT